MENLKDTFSITDAAKQSGLSPRKIRYLEELGHIVPEYIKIGSICQGRYSPALIAQLAQIARLRREGFELDAAVAAVDSISLLESLNWAARSAPEKW